MSTEVRSSILIIFFLSTFYCASIISIRIKEPDALFYFYVVIALVCLSGACVTGSGLFAPKFIAEGVHLDAREMTENQCLKCHRDGKDGVPIAPKAMLNRKNCIRCHLKE